MMVNIFICYDEKHRGSLRCAGEAKLKTFRQQFFLSATACERGFSVMSCRARNNACFLLMAGKSIAVQTGGIAALTDHAARDHAAPRDSGGGCKGNPFSRRVGSAHQ
jgi:hypothetical protein